MQASALRSELDDRPQIGGLVGIRRRVSVSIGVASNGKDERAGAASQIEFPATYFDSAPLAKAAGMLMFGSRS